MTPETAASYCDHAFEAAQRALAGGQLEAFSRFAEIHKAYAELFHHLNNGGSIQ